MNAEALKQNIIDSVKETQMKLGSSYEQLMFYYPGEALTSLMECDVSAEVLASFCDMVHNELPRLRFRFDMGRWCALVSADAAKRIHETVPDSPFLKAFLDCMAKPGCGMDDVMNTFRSFSDHAAHQIHEEDGEEEHIFFFTDDFPDPYRYCVHFEMGRAIYHRFTKKECERLWNV